MKKFFVLIMALVAVIILTGCNTGEVVNKGPLDPSPRIIEEITIKEIVITPITIR